MTRPNTLGLGIIGLGYAGLAMADAACRHPQVELKGVADTDQGLREEVAARYEVNSLVSIDELVELAGVDAVYVATPTRYHHHHAMTVAAADLHLVLEKPMAANMPDAEEICAAFERSGRALVVGYSQSFDLPAQSLAALVRSRSVGALRAINTLCYTDWIRRPRKPEDLDVSLGGGVTFRQGAHQLDIIRLVVGTSARRVRATGIPSSEGSALAAYSALVEFEGGVYASATYSGLGFFDSRVLTFGVGEAGERLAQGSAGYRKLLPPPAPAAAPMFGMTIATFEEADVLPGPDGLLIERGGQAREEPYPPGPSGWDAVLSELVGAAVDGRPPLHDGRWGARTLELCAAVETSAATGRDVWLSSERADA